MRHIFIIILFVSLSLKSQIPTVCDSIIYTSSYNELVSNKIEHLLNEVSFTILDRYIQTSMNGRMSLYNIDSLVNKGEDKTKIWQKYKCTDKGLSDVYILLAYEKTSKTKVIIITYTYFYMYFEVKPIKIMPDIYEGLCDLEKNGYVGDSLYNHNYTNEQVKTFLTQFGEPTVIMNMIVKDLYKDKKQKVIEKYNSQGILTSKSIEYEIDK